MAGGVVVGVFGDVVTELSKVKTLSKVASRSPYLITCEYVDPMTT